MDINQLWHRLQEQLDGMKCDLDQVHHPIVERVFHSLRETLEDFLQEQVVSGVEHPHPRSRLYRSEPVKWQMKDVSASLVLEEILSKHQKSSRKTCCVFDLDGTLFDVGYRTLGIIDEWLKSDIASSFEPYLLKKVAKINYNHIGYSLLHAFENAGFDLRNQQVIRLFMSIEKLWKKRFFTNEALVLYDKQISKAVEFVRFLHGQGIHIVYLTGRYNASMREGTLQQLQQFTFPLDNVSLILKDHVRLEDQIYKSEAMKEIAQKFDVLANFENEYFNLSYMSLEVPEAIEVIVDSQHSGRMPSPVSQSIYRIQNYELGNTI